MVTIETTRKIRYHGWTLPKGHVADATDTGNGYSAPHPRVEGAFISVPKTAARLASAYVPGEGFRSHRGH